MYTFQNFWRGKLIWVALGLLLIAATAISPLVLTIHQVKADQSSTGGNWSTYMADKQHSGFNETETTINATSASKLKVHWVASGGNAIFSQPVTANGKVYWGSGDGFEHASNLGGGLVWRQYLGQTHSRCGPNSFGVVSTAAVTWESIGGTMTSLVIVGGGDSYLYALNAATGAVVWRTLLGAPSSNTFIWDSPVVYRGSVYIGTASLGDCPVIPGQLLRINASTGSIQNTFNVVPGGCKGGGIWGSPAIDTVNNAVYFTTGNGGWCSVPEPNTLAMVKLNATTLSFISSWHIPKSQRVTDSDFGTTPTLFSASIRGSVHQLVGAANKNGLYYAFDRANIGNGPVWTVRIAAGGDCPECGDGSISSSAWDGSRLYVAGGDTSINGSRCRGGLRALNPATGRFIWQYCLKQGTVLGSVTAVPGVVAVVGGPDLVLVNAGSGKGLFAYKGLNAKSHFYGSPSISKGVLYIGNLDRRLYALGT